MNPYDTEAVRKVWARVTATQEDRFAAMLAQERHDRDTYFQLARKFPRYANFFRSLASEEQRHARQLANLYYLLYGIHPEVAVLPPKRYTSLLDALQERYKEALSAVKKYQQAAGSFPEHSTLFLSLAAEEAHHAERLRAFLSRTKQLQK